MYIFLSRLSIEPTQLWENLPPRFCTDSCNIIAETHSTQQEPQLTKVSGDKGVLHFISFSL